MKALLVSLTLSFVVPCYGQDRPIPSAQKAISQKHSKQPGAAGGVVHGTLNVVLANGNGIVAATDSMVTVIDNGRAHQSLLPAQKLFKIDDTTVCTIAGFASKDWSPFRGATTDIASIIYSFSRRLRHEQLAGRPHIPFRFKLNALEAMIVVRLDILAASASIVGGTGPRPTGDYRFKLIMAGYDADGSSWLGTFSLDALPDISMSGRYYHRIRASPITVERVSSKVIFMTGGVDNIASPVLQGITFSSGPPIMKYNESKRLDGGATLSIDEMEAVASYLLKRTSIKYREVGGDNQVAVLYRDGPIKLIQPPLSEPTSTIEPLLPVINESFADVRQAVGPGFQIPVIYIGDRFVRTGVSLDGNYFVGNEFRSCRLSYGGSEILGLDSTNNVVDSFLSVSGNVDRKSKELDYLLRSFNWLGVIYEETKPANTPATPK
jgi:hypothetical protein